MKKYILDTDIGVDCDDAVAIAIMLNYQKMGKIELAALTASSTRSGAVSTLRAICAYYGAEIPVGKMALPAIPCDSKNNYSQAVMEKYGQSDEAEESVSLIRKTLGSATEKVTLVAVGPLTNICRLLQSEGDSYSPLNGAELVKQTVDKLYIMGGAFQSNYDGVYAPKREAFPEWNILQDISSARYVAEHFPCETLYCPHEAGAQVYTNLGQGDNPVWYSMLSFAKNEENNPTGEGFRRMSWDPITCIVAVEGVKDFYRLSPAGSISVNEKGITVFDESQDKGHQYLVLKGEFERLSAYVNSLVERR